MKEYVMFLVPYMMGAIVGCTIEYFIMKLRK